MSSDWGFLIVGLLLIILAKLSSGFWAVTFSVEGTLFILFAVYLAWREEIHIATKKVRR